MPTEQSQQTSSVDGTLYLADCLDALTTLPNNSIDCIITDPPYGTGYQSRSQSLALTRIANDGPEAYELLDKALALATDKLKPNSHIYVFTDWHVFAPMAKVVRTHFNLKNALIWVKNNTTRGDLRGNYGYRHEIVLYAHKGRRHLNGRRDSNVLACKRVPTQAMRHPTEKPVKLLEYFITKSTNEGEVVLDMFMGSGTTCVAAKRLKRRYIGIELEQIWYDVARERLEEATCS